MSQSEERVEAALAPFDEFKYLLVEDIQLTGCLKLMAELPSNGLQMKSSVFNDPFLVISLIWINACLRGL